MAKVSKQIRTDDEGRTTTRWLARWRDDQGVQRKKTFTKKADADRYVRNIGTDLDRGEYVDPSNPVTVAEYARRWAESRPHRPKTAERTESMIRNHIEGTPLGARRMTAVLPSEVQGWVTSRSKMLAPTTLRAVVKLLRSIFLAAVHDRVIARSPAVRLSLPPVAKERVVPLSVAQVLALANAIGVRYRALIIVQAALGLRLGELLGLRISDVDFLRRTVRIQHQADVRTHQLAQLKTDSSYRVVPLPQVAADALAEHLARFPASADFPCSCGRPECVGEPASGLVFHTTTANTLDHGHYGTRVFSRGIERANEAALAACKACDGNRWVIGANGRRAEPARRCEHAGQVPTGTTSHDLRHHYASVLLAAGESVVAVAERLGHDDATLVLTTYGHLMPNTDERTRRAVDDAWTVPASVPADVEPASSAPGVPRAIMAVR